MAKPTIAIDGYSSTGKSSISKVLAKKLGLIHLDTGAMYRGVALFAIQNCLDSNEEIDSNCLISKLPEIQLEFIEENGEDILYLNEKNVNNEIREPQISNLSSSVVAKIREVREFLTKIQRQLAEKGGIIIDGRDIGTVVLPNADYKFFLTASVEERANRRFLELKNSGIESDLETVKQNLIQRDKVDTEREISPLKQAHDAILIDNTLLTKEQTIEKILSYIKPV